MINTESYVDRSARRVNRAAWKQSQCVASGQPPALAHAAAAATNPAHSAHASAAAAAAAAARCGGQSITLVQFGNQPYVPRSNSALNHNPQQSTSSISISSGSVSSIASSLATSGATGKHCSNRAFAELHIHKSVRE